VRGSTQGSHHAEIAAHRGEIEASEMVEFNTLGSASSRFRLRAAY